jgi:hypothetical protein
MIILQLFRLRLFGSESCPFTPRIWIALQFRGVDNDVKDKKIAIACFHKPGVNFPPQVFYPNPVWSSWGWI